MSAGSGCPREFGGVLRVSPGRCGAVWPESLGPAAAESASAAAARRPAATLPVAPAPGASDNPPCPRLNTSSASLADSGGVEGRSRPLLAAQLLCARRGRVPRPELSINVNRLARWERALPPRGVQGIDTVTLYSLELRPLRVRIVEMSANADSDDLDSLASPWREQGPKIGRHKKK